ncbi:MAG: hypothetical protein JSS52_11505 [Proteobacteria bacterium]|nr:hypothetical protein [Pseudomonadota bacterium]
MDRKELIEKAVKRAHTEWDRIQNWDRDDRRTYAEVVVDSALAVFEEAHAPTDDEHAALVHVLWDQVPEDWDENDIGILADAVLAAGFHRTVQGEPSDAQADAARIAFHEFCFGPNELLSERDLGIARLAWKAALRAAAETGWEHRGS